MSISLPTYTRREMPLLGRGDRIRAIAANGLRREFRRFAAAVVIGVGTLFTVVSSIVTLFLAPVLLGGQPLDLSFFYIPAASPAILISVTLMASVIGSGLIADDLHTMSLSLYLSRPITHLDYLIAKAAILVPLISMVAVFPLLLTPFLAALLGMFSWVIVLQAMGLSLLIGLLLTVFYASVSLFLSSITRRKSYAAAGVFAVTFGLAIPAELLAVVTENQSLVYLSPWQDFLAVARAVFGAAAGPIDWPGGLAILLGVTVLASVSMYLRMRAVEVVSG